MITIVQRVQRAAVRVDGDIVGEIGPGALLLVGIEQGDTERDVDATVQKIHKLRFFAGRTPMDRTLAETNGGCLVVSQFTLAADLCAGNRPSFTYAAAPERANELYERCARGLAAAGLQVATGRFGAAMAVELVNDGPVTFVLIVRDGRVVRLPAPPAPQEP